jgi:hypothetical protein
LKPGENNFNIAYKSSFVLFFTLHYHSLFRIGCSNEEEECGAKNVGGII